MGDEVGRALPEVAVRALEPEELWQLRARQIERQSGFEPHQHGLGEEADRIAGADQPRRKRNRARSSASRAAARAAWRSGSPALRSPTDAPISSDSAEVTVMTVCFELQKIQKTSPENRQAYRPASGASPASDASPMPAGSRYAASVRPATRSGRSHSARYSRTHRSAGEGRCVAACSWVQNVTATARTNVGFSSSGLKTYPVTSSCLNEKPASRPRWMSRSVW